jgi:hypothetical protein
LKWLIDHLWLREQKACDHKLREAKVPKWKNSFPEVSSFATVIEDMMKKHANEAYSFVYPVKNYFETPAVTCVARFVLVAAHVRIFSPLVLCAGFGRLF